MANALKIINRYW